jgi:integrase
MYTANRNPRTRAVRLTALSQWHRYQGFTDPTQDPTVRKTLQGVRRLHGRPRRQARALRLDQLATMLRHLEQLPVSNKTHRDRALIQVGFFGAFRRSELVSLQVADLDWVPEGLLITLPRSKTDPHGEGLTRALARGQGAVCPVRALKTWLTVAGIDQGPVFRPVNRWDQIQPRALYAGAVNVLLKETGEACGFDFTPELSSHSLRRGMASSAARAEVDFAAIQKQGGWRSEATVRDYIEEGRRFEDNATVTLLEQIAVLMAKA